MPNPPPRGYAAIAPDLVIEVLSPDDLAPRCLALKISRSDEDSCARAYRLPSRDGQTHPMSIWDIITQSGQDLLRYAVRKLQFQLPADPAPRHWFDILDRNVPLARALTASEKDRLLRVARLLIDEVPFEGVHGVSVTEEMRVTIAATASLLIYRFPYPRFTKLVRILLYPDTFVPKRAESHRDALVIDEEDPTLGQAWADGMVVLSWDAVMRDALHEHGEEGNVVLHELAHILDAEDGIFDGTPVFDDTTQGSEWGRVLTTEFARQQQAVHDGEEPPIDSYGAKNRAEFFAVATEAFFCSPDRLRARLPALYEQLNRLYRPPLGSLR
jgi:Mlc titration factor MtfA (ptsG expression regulator)